MSNCGNCGSSTSLCVCNFQVQDSPTVNWTLIGNGSLATPWSLSGVVGSTVSNYRPYINGTDSDGVEYSAGTIGYTILEVNPPFGGGYETLNLNPIHLATDGLIDFQLSVGPITQPTSILVTVYASTTDCLSKLKAVSSFDVDVPDSFTNIPLGAGGVGDWTVSTFGPSLRLEAEGDNVIVAANAPVCCITEMFIFWISGPH